MTTAYVLSGGSNLGAVQVGMLLALEQAGPRPDLVVGTSVGAVNGAWVASGRPVEELATIWRGLERSDVFPISPITGVLGLLGLRDHLVSPRGLEKLLAEHLPLARMEDAAVPLSVVATDVLTGADVRLASGPADQAILASAAIPGVFPPVQIGDRVYIDGGVVNNAPVSHAVSLGADTVWVLATGHSCDLPEPPDSALGMALHGVTLSIHQRLALDVERYVDSVDLRVVPPLCPVDLAPTDFDRADDLIRRAREQTEEWLGRPRVDPAEAVRLLWEHGHRAET